MKKKPIINFKGIARNFALVLHNMLQRVRGRIPARRMSASEYSEEFSLDQHDSKNAVGNFVLCSSCFRDQGLRLDAEYIGIESSACCKNCGLVAGRKLTKGLVEVLAYRFFVWGTVYRWEYGATPLVQFNDRQRTSIDVAPWVEPDMRLIESTIGVGFFYYGPRMWMLGEVEPLKALQDPATRGVTIARIIGSYPTATLTPKQTFYRLRKCPKSAGDFHEYDSPPAPLSGNGRLDSHELPVMYGSQDLQICIHECRVSVEDDIFVATLEPKRTFKLLDLSCLLHEDKVTEFESLDMAVHMLFLAGKHSYPISRDIGRFAYEQGFDGLIYPSYFSLLRTGGMPFETVYGISHRRFPQLAEYEKSKIIPNLALFGRPIEQGYVGVHSINKLILNQVEYGIHFGPVGLTAFSEA